MSIVTAYLPAPRQRAFEALCDARSIRDFVVGARNVRRFDPRWPEAGTAVQHSIGVAPLVIRDETRAVTCEAPYRLVLEAHAGPLGTFRVTFDLFDGAPEGATTLRIEEYPLSGPFTLPGIRQISDAVIHLRNWEMSRRLRRLVANRERQRTAEHRDA